MRQYVLRTIAIVLFTVASAFGSCAKDFEGPANTLINAKTVDVMSQLGSAGSGRTRPNAKRAKSQVEAALKKWGRFQIVDSPAKADLVLIVTESTMPASQTGGAFPMSPHKLYAMDLLSDSLAVYKGGGLKADSKPLWKGTEVGEDMGLPAERVVARFRKDLESELLKSAMKSLH